MTEQLITEKTALLAREKGYPYFFSNGKDTWQATQNLLQRWLREEKAINVFIQRDVNGSGYEPLVEDDEDKTHLSIEGFETYEEALEAGLTTALKLL